MINSDKKKCKLRSKLKNGESSWNNIAKKSIQL